MTQRGGTFVVPVDDVRSQGRHGASLACVRASPVHASP